jgi:hypothetical protein
LPPRRRFAHLHRKQSLDNHGSEKSRQCRWIRRIQGQFVRRMMVVLRVKMPMEAALFTIGLSTANQLPASLAVQPVQYEPCHRAVRALGTGNSYVA